MCSKLKKSRDTAALENCIFVRKSVKGLLPPGSNFILNLTALMILEGQISVIIKYPLTVLKSMVDIQ